MMIFARLKPVQRKLGMVGYLALLLLLAVWGAGDALVLVRAVVILAVYVVTDLLWTWVRDRRTYVPLSSVISALIGSIVLDPQSPWWVMVAFPLLAVAGKQLIRWQRRHLFNPAAFSLVVLSLVHPAVIAWWGVAWWGTGWKLAVLLFGLFLLSRIRRYPVALPFLTVYALGLALVFASRGQGVGAVWPLLFDGTLLFFATVMLVEPVTTSYRTKRIQILYGAGVGLLAVLMPLVGIPLPDGFLPPLLVGNLLASLASVRRRAHSPSLPAPQPVTPVSS